MAEIRDIPADVERLRKGDWIAFPWSYNGGVGSSRGTDPLDQDIEVAQISYIDENSNGRLHIIVHFLYGYKSISEDMSDLDVIAIGSKSGKDDIKLFKGFYKFHILQPEHPTFLKWQERFKDR